jgi:pimeloyl-ACP methyl ester carboxylesterase
MKEDADSGQRPPAVVFIHGIGGSARVWMPQIAGFEAAGFVAAALDLPGYGARAPVTTMNFESLAEDVEVAIAARGLRRPILVGHSMGGMVVQTALRRRPDGYRAAVLCCTSPAFGNPSGDFQHKFVADRLRPLDAGGTMSELAPNIVERIIGPDAEAEGRAIAIEVMSTVPADTYRAAVRCLVSFDERANLGRISVPILCLAGEKDPIAPAQVMERMASKISGGRYVCLAGVGHLPNLEAPAAFHASVVDFLREVLAKQNVSEHIDR